MLTVLFATRNRGRSLPGVLDSFCQLRSPSSGWKLILVDNGSTDLTGEVVRSFTNRLPLLFLVESKLGKNAALNTGLNEVEGDLVVFTDDDVFPNPDWLIKLRLAADSHPEYSIFGGPVVPRWEVSPPSWIQWVEQSPAYAITDPSIQDGPILPRLVYGPNMAIRASLFAAGTRFDTSIGPRGASYPQGGETELIIRLDRQGHKAWHVRAASVEHLIRRDQLKKSWVMQRAVRFGRGEYRLGHTEASSNSDLWLGAPRELVRGMVKEGLNIVKATMLLRPERAFRCSWCFHYLRGQIFEARNLARDQRLAGKVSTP